LLSLSQELEVREAIHEYNSMRQAQFRMNSEITLNRGKIFALQKRLKEEQQLRGGGAHSLNEPLKERGQIQQKNWHAASQVFVPDPEWPTPVAAATGVPVHGDQGLWCTRRIHGVQAGPQL
jgi:hypothetical protein